MDYITYKRYKGSGIGGYFNIRHGTKVTENGGFLHAPDGRGICAVTSEDGVTVIARHMNYGLYKVEGKSDCPGDALNICRMLSLKPEIMKMIEEKY